jgi:anaerobic magnesium-protoporphyrin IX monomethyl ester cyclase
LRVQSQQLLTQSQVFEDEVLLSFCSIQTFYRAAPGKIVRTRKPARVVEEMRMLHEERGITIFLFQDDDFPLFGAVWRR